MPIAAASSDASIKHGGGMRGRGQVNQVAAHTIILHTRRYASNGCQLLHLSLMRHGARDSSRCRGVVCATTWSVRAFRRRSEGNSVTKSSFSFELDWCVRISCLRRPSWQQHQPSTWPCAPRSPARSRGYKTRTQHTTQLCPSCQTLEHLSHTHVWQHPSIHPSRRLSLSRVRTHTYTFRIHTHTQTQILDTHLRETWRETNERSRNNNTRSEKHGHRPIQHPHPSRRHPWATRRSVRARRHHHGHIPHTLSNRTRDRDCVWQLLLQRQCVPATSYTLCASNLKTSRLVPLGHAN